MKSAEEYAVRLYITDDGEPKCVHDTFENVLETIKIAQYDAIDETCKVCAENAYAKPVSTITEGGHLMELWTVNEDSILNCAEILKK